MQESPLFVKLFDLVVWVVPLTTKFPRSQRFVLAEALQRATLAAYEAAIRAGHAKIPVDVARHLDDMALELALIRFQLRLAERLMLITVQQYEYASEKLTEIGRLLQAWRRSNEAKNEAKQADPSAVAP